MSMSTMSTEEQYVTRAEFHIALAARDARLDACETDRDAMRDRHTTLDRKVTNLGEDVAEVKTEVKSLLVKQDAQTLILERLDKIWDSFSADPRVALITKLLLAALLAWLTSKVNP